LKWSKLKKEIENRFAESLKGRIYLYSTRYTSASYTMSRGWITFDGKEVVNFSTPDSVNEYGRYYNEVTKSNCASHPSVKDFERTPGKVIEKGEFSRYDFHEACWTFLNLSIEDALKNENPIISSLAILDHRLGKRRLKEIDQEGLHPLIKRMLQIRLYTEGINKVYIFKKAP
jgi:hypothetical protein